MTQLNTYSDVSGIANAMQENALFVIRETAQMQSYVRMYNDMTGLNPRKGYQYNKAAAATIGETDDLTSSAFTPSLLATLTPAEIGLQFFVTDSRAESELPENIIRDGSLELGLAASDKVETDIVGDFASLTGGTIGTAGSTITWGYMAAAISQARNANKNVSVPLVAVIHGYQWAVLAKAASVAGATVAVAPNFQDRVTAQSPLGQVSQFMGVPIFQTFQPADTNADFTGAVFARDAIAMDWRRAVRIEAQRDSSRRGTEYNMSAVYAHGVWRAALGVKMIFDAAAPTA
jgi:hypothetical protein